MSPVQQPPPPPPPPGSPPQTTRVKGQFDVDLPNGGKLTLKDADEVKMWKESKKKYMDDFGLNKANDLMMLGAILSQALIMYRAQSDLLEPKKATNAQNVMINAAKEIRELEKALGIDKKTREAGGKHETRDYVTQLKRAAHAKGVRIVERTKEYEAFAMELRWKLRLLRNGDDEDKEYEGITESSVLEWAERKLAELESKDQEWADQKGKLYVGRL